MRLQSVALLVVIAILPLTEVNGEPPFEVDALQPAIADMTGAQLFEHEWQHHSAADRKELDAENGAARFGRHGDSKLEATRRFFEQRSRSFEFSMAGGTTIGDGHGDGLGPLHNGSSCAQCHPGGGAAGVQHNVTLITIDPRSKALRKPIKKYAKQLFEVFPGLLNELGNLKIETVVHDQSSHDGYDQIRDELAHYVPGGIEDSWFRPSARTSKAIAARPVIAGRHKDVDFYLSQRNPPALFGLGAINRVSQRTLEFLAEEQARRTEGKITGRIASKFGWRGQIPTLDAFVSQACAGELGLTQYGALQAGDPADVGYVPPGIDMTHDEVTKLVSFVSSLPHPTEGIEDHPNAENVYEGEALFNEVGCADCHVADVNPVMNLFSDLLLHDMGPDLQAPSPAPVAGAHLADVVSVAPYPLRGPINGEQPPYYSAVNSQSIPQPETISQPAQPQFPRGERPEVAEDKKTDVLASSFGESERRTMTWDDLQREWRTPPLWGVADTAPYLHDGRAETLEDAILWHGGEAKSSRDRFASLDATEQQQVLEFLRSLKAPNMGE